MRYRYDVEQKSDGFSEAFVLYNPLTLLGFPTGSGTTAATGRLEILRGGQKVVGYEATCSVVQRRTIYSSRNLSAPRRQALVEVRDDIDSQLAADRDRIMQLLSTERIPPE